MLLIEKKTGIPPIPYIFGVGDVPKLYGLHFWSDALIKNEDRHATPQDTEPAKS